VNAYEASVGQLGMTADPVRLLQVTAVLVTYGHRWHLLSRVLEELLRQEQVGTIVVVDNGSPYDLQGEVNAAGLTRVKLLSMGENSGSAGGFAAGIREAYEGTSAELIWLLDDDNRPKQGCLQSLLLTYAALNADSRNVLLCLRDSRKDQALALAGERQMRVKQNSFLGFHLTELPSKIRRHLRRTPPDPRWRSEIVPAAFAPYGGLFLHRSWISRVGVPDRNFYLYGDDHEYTGRITAAGGRILLVGYCEIEDLEESWVNEGNRAISLVSRSSSAARVFYSTRNRVYWEWRNFVTSRIIYFVNIATYLTLLVVWGLILERAPVAMLRRVRLIFDAIRAAIHGQLGKKAAGVQSAGVS